MEMDRLCILAIAVVAAAAGPTRSPEPAPPELSGRWRLNAEQSEDARQKMGEAGRRRGGGERGGPGGGGFGGRRGGHMGGRGRPDGDPRQRMRAALEAPEELTITQTQMEIVVVEKDGRLRTLHPDGKKYKNDAGDTEIKSWWDKGRMVVETRAERGPRITETLSLAADRSRLEISVLFETSFGDPVTVRRVYDPVAAE